MASATRTSAPTRGQAARNSNQDRVRSANAPRHDIRDYGAQENRETRARLPLTEVAPPRVVGLIEGANHRIDSLTDRLSNLTGTLANNLDRNLGSQPDIAGAGGTDCPSGDAHLLHYRISVLENAVEALDRQVARTADL